MADRRVFLGARFVSLFGGWGVEVVFWVYVQCRLRGPGIQTLERGGHILNQSSKVRSLVSKLHLHLSSFVAKMNFTTEVCIPGPLRLDEGHNPFFVEFYRFILIKLALFARPISHMSISVSIYVGKIKDPNPNPNSKTKFFKGKIFFY